MAINHADTTDIHLFAYVAATDPGAVGGGKAWVDTSGTTKILKVRNVANTGWDTVGSNSSPYDEANPVKDTGNNNLLAFTKTASAVNFAGVKNAAAGGTPEIYGAGSDANVSLILRSKGTGKIQIRGPVGGSTPYLSFYNEYGLYESGTFSGSSWQTSSGEAMSIQTYNANLTFSNYTADASYKVIFGSLTAQFNNAPIFSGFTAGSIPFIGASGVLAQDNTGLFWDNTNKKLTLTNSGNDDGLILKNANTNYAPALSFKFNNTTVAARLQPDYNGGLKINANTGQYIDLGGFQGVPGKLVVQGYAYESSGTAVLAQSLAAGVVGLGVKLAASQTADAFQILDNSSAVLAKFSNNGTLELGSSGGTGLLAAWYGASKYMQTNPSNLSALLFNNQYKLSWVDNVGATGQNTGIGRFADGVIGVQAGYGSKGAIDLGSPTAATVALAIKLAASQTADAVQIQNNAGSVVTRVNASGDVCSAYLRGSAGTGNTYINNDGANLILSFNAANVCQIQDSSASIYARYNAGMAIYNKFNLSTETPTQLTANQNNYSGLTDLKVVHRLSSDAARSITGIVPGTAADGLSKTLINIGSFNITLANESTSSTAANRFTCSTGADIVLAPNEAAEIFYDSTSTRWRVFKK